jgi:hypothetical protein
VTADPFDRYLDEEPLATAEPTKVEFPKAKGPVDPFGAAPTSDPLSVGPGTIHGDHLRRNMLDPYDVLDGCELDFTEDPDDDETAELRALFPEGVADDRWEGVL